MFRRLSETGLDSYLVGRGNLNLNHNILIFNDIYGFSFVVEYHLEYRFPKRYFAWDSNLRPSRMLGLSAVPKPRYLPYYSHGYVSGFRRRRFWLSLPWVKIFGPMYDGSKLCYVE